MNVINLSRSAKSFLGILWISGLFWLGTALYAEAPSASPDAALTRNHLLVQLLDGPAEQPVGWKLLGVLVLIALATLITEDLTCVVTGLMIANGTLLWSQGLTACLLGILFGDFLLYLAGRRLGRPAIRKIPLRWMIDPVKLMETEDWFHRRGGLTILISRFVPGTRLPAYVAAGILGVPCLKFTAYFVLAALIWTPSLIWISTKLAGKALLGIQKYNQEAPWVVLALILTYVVVLKIFIPCLSWRGRRLLVGRWRRWTRPEYWPTSVLYFPVFFYLVFRALRAGRHPMDFSACNPFIPGA
ncbi:MAG: DedA family protein, partial [Kiritimatiellia bacterium]